METPEHFIEYLPWVVFIAVVFVCIVGWLIANRDLNNRK